MRKEIRVHSFGGKENGTMIIGKRSALKELGEELISKTSFGQETVEENWPKLIVKRDVEGNINESLSFHIECNRKNTPPTKTQRSIFQNLTFIFTLIGVLSVIFVIYKLAFSLPFFPADFKEFERLSSPDNTFEAIITKYEPTSFTTPRHKLYIVPKGTPYSSNSALFEFNNYESTAFSINQIKWINDNLLIIERSKSSRVYNFIPEAFILRDGGDKTNPKDFDAIKLELITR